MQIRLTIHEFGYLGPAGIFQEEIMAEDSPGPGMAEVWYRVRDATSFPSVLCQLRITCLFGSYMGQAFVKRAVYNRLKSVGVLVDHDDVAGSGPGAVALWG